MSGMLDRRALLRGALALAGCGLPPVRARANALRVGATAPAAMLTTLAGERIATADLIGQVVLLTFWATWCEPCRSELPLFSTFYDRYRSAGFCVLGFGLDDPDRLDAVRSVASGLAFPVGLLSRSTAPGYGRIWRLPVSFLIDRAGILRVDGWQLRPPAWSEATLREHALPWIEQPEAGAP